MKKKYIILVFQFCVYLSFSQELIKITESTDRNVDPIVVNLDEFENIFYKNNNNSEITLDYLDEYIDLYLKFKLKVIEAQALGYDTSSKFINELEGYRQQLAKPYLRNKDFDEQMLAEAYQRKQFDINASHILITINQESSKDEEKKAYDKALSIRDKIINKDLNFTDAAKQFSDDQSAKFNGGNLGYFTAFMMVYDFETAAYNTSVDEISMPIRTKFGYHLIQVNDKRKAVGNVKVAHIMFKTAKDANENQINEAYKKAVNAMDLLQSGDEFTDVAERFSEDRKTAVNGGMLPEFGVGKMVPEFENEAFKLQNIGDISQPFKTDFGWHIIKLIDKKTIPAFSDIKSELRSKIDRDSRSQLSTQALYEKLRNEYKVVNKPSIYAKFRRKLNSSIKNGVFKIESSDKSELLTIDGISISVKEFAEYIVKNQAKNKDVDQMYIDFVNAKLVSYEESKLEEKYPEYKAILNEYKEGILLFDITSDNVWNKAIEDTLGLKFYFNMLSYRYSWPERLNATIYSCIDQSTANIVMKNITKKNKKSGWTMSNRATNYSVDELVKLCNTESPLSLQVENNNFSKGENKFIDEVIWKKGTIKKIKLNNDSYVIIEVHDILSPSEKTIDETRGKVISDYQGFLEKIWIFQLRKKYLVDINFNTLYSLTNIENYDITKHTSKVNLTTQDYFRSIDKYISDSKLTYQTPMDSLISSIGLSADIAFFKMEWDEDLVSEDKRDEIFNKAFLELASEIDVDFIKLLDNQHRNY